MSGSAELLTRFREGDPTAAEELFARYIVQLTGLARASLSARLAQRIDPEDITLSVYRSFFLRVRAGQFTLERSGDLWKLLVAMTLHKLRRTVAHHRAEKRAMDRETGGTELSELLAVDRAPTPEEALVAADELDHLLAPLSSLQRRVVELRLQEFSLDEIAADVSRSERTVRRILEDVRRHWADRLGQTRQDSNPAASSDPETRG